MKNHATITEHEKLLIFIRILYNLKKRIPNNGIFWYLFFITKFIGPFIIVSSYSNLENDFINVLRNLVYYKDFKNEINQNFFQIFSLIIYFLVPVPVLLIFYIYYQKTTIYQRADNLMKLEKKYKILIKIAGVLILLILIFSQHIIEILSISLIQVIIQNSNINSTNFNINNFKSPNVYHNIISFGNSLYLTSYPTFILNFLYIFFINVIIYYFIKYSNDITSGFDSRIKMNNSNILYISISIIGNLQAFQYYDMILENEKTSIRLIFIIISLIIMSYPCFNLLLDMIYKSSVGKLLMILQLLCIVLGLINIIFPDLENSIFMIALKFFISGTFAFLIFSNIEKKTYQKIENKLNKNFFEDNKRINLKLLLFIIEKLTSQDKIVGNLYFFIEIISAHKRNCKYRKCSCNRYESFSNVENIELKNFQEIDEMIKLITEVIENELFVSIVNTTSDSFVANKEFCLLHIDFVYNVKKSDMLAYYLIDVYTNQYYDSSKIKQSHHQIPDTYVLFKLFEFKKIIFKGCIKKKIKEVKFYNSIEFLNDLNFLKGLISKNFSNYEKLFGLKQNILNNFLYESKLKKNSFGGHKYDINRAKLNNQVYSFENIIDLCEELAHDYKALKNYLKLKYSINSLRNAEVSFVLYNFYMLFNKKVSFSIKNFFSVYEKYENILFLDTVYKEIEMRHPMILKIDTKMNFNIKYISQKLCDLIFYQKNDLIDREMHILLPEIFVDMHSKIVKNYIFVEKQKKLTIESFLVTKKFHYFPAIIKSVIFASLDYNLNILIDIKPIIKVKESFFEEYYFILDRKMNSICFTRSFEEKYCLNLEFFKRLKINFCDLFGINYVLLNTSFEEEIKKIEKNSYSILNPNRNSNISNNKGQSSSNENLGIEDNGKNNVDFFSNLKNITKKNTKRNTIIDEETSSKVILGDEYTKKAFTYQKGKSVEYIIKKDKIMPSILKLKNSIYEKESDKDLYDKLVNFEKKINQRITDVNFFNRQQSIFSNNFIRGSTIFKNQKKKGKLDLFSLYFQLVSIGNIPYYLIKIIDLDMAATLNNSIISNSLNLSIQNNTLNNDFLGTTTKKPITTVSLFKDSTNNKILKVNIPTFKEDSLISVNNFQHINLGLNASNKSLLNPSYSNNIPNNYRKASNVTFAVNNNGNSYSCNNLISFMNNSVNNPLLNNTFTNNSMIQGKMSINASENENVKKLNYDNLNNNIYTKITSAGTTTKPNFVSKKKHLKNFKSQNNKTKISKLEKNIKGNFIFFFYISLILLFIILICDYPLKLTTLTFSHKLSEINYFILGMKSEVFSTASAIITACTRADNIDSKSINGFENTLDKIKNVIGKRSKDLNSFTYRFFSYLDAINYEGVDELFKIINQEDNYNFLYTDWNTYKRNSTFIIQLKNFNYLCSFLKRNDNFTTCRVRERFYNRNFNFDFSNLKANINSNFLSNQENLQIQTNSKDNNNQVSLEETILYYVFENIITIYKNKLLSLTLISNSILESYHKKAATILISYNSVNLFLLIFCFFLMFYLIIYKKNKVMQTFLKLFTNKNSDKYFEMKIMNFKTILNCFDQTKCIDYETKKQDIAQLALKASSELKQKSKIEDPAKSKKLFKADKTSSLYSGSERNPALISSKDKSSLRGDLASLNSANRLKESSSNNFDIYSNDFLEQVKFDHLDLKVYSFGRWFLFFGGIVLITLNLINLIENSTKFEGLIKGNIIASNFLERMPKICELILYYKISIIYNNIYFIKNNNAKENIHLNYYNISIDVTKEGIFNSLKGSQYSNIYYQFRVIQSNLKMFMNDLKDEKILENIRILESELNTKDFCYFLSLAYTELADEFNGSFRSGFKLMNDNALECKNIGNGINSNPLSSILESVLKIINNNYYDFKNSIDKNITKFIGNDEIIRANLEIEYVFKKIHDSIMFLIKNDIDSMYNNTLNTEISYSTASIVIIICYITIFLIFVINKLKRYESNLTYTFGRFKKALMQK